MTERAKLTLYPLPGSQRVEYRWKLTGPRVGDADISGTSTSHTNAIVEAEDWLYAEDGGAVPFGTAIDLDIDVVAHEETVRLEPRED